MSPVGACSLLFISVSVCYWVPAGCYPNGKVTAACGSMQPRHGSHAGQTTPSPYRLETNATTFSPSDRIQVVLSGTTFFNGFLLQARDAANQGSVSTVGTFTLTKPTETQLLTCNNQQGSAVSQTSKAKKSEVAVIWNAPADAPQQVQFFVTVVAHYDTFWVKVPGPIITQHGVTPHPPQSGSTPPPITTTTHSPLPGPFTSEGCGQSKTCLLDPPRCDPKEDPECFFLSMRTDGPHSTSVTFELSGPAKGYVAFALSWDTWMGNDDVYMCVMDNQRVTVSAALLRGRTPPEDASQAVLSSVLWRLADGVIQCTFSRPVSATHQEPARFDLNQEYFLFLASGQAQDGEIWKHDRQPLISNRKILITGVPDIVKGSRSPIYLKSHGALMLFAWMLTGSVGTFIASFYKPDWSNKTLFGQKIWFQVHRGLMMLTVTLTAVAFCLPFVYRKGWSKHAGVHPYLGCCVLTLSLIQPIMAAIRPSPDSQRRFIFNWAHWGVGSVTEIMAVAAMFLGTRQPTLLLPQPWATHILIGYVAWLALLRFLLLMHKHFCIKISASGSQDSGTILSNQSEQSSWESLVKSLMLAFLILGNAGLLMPLLSFIALV